MAKNGWQEAIDVLVAEAQAGTAKEVMMPLPLEREAGDTGGGFKATMDKIQSKLDGMNDETKTHHLHEVFPDGSFVYEKRSAGSGSGELFKQGYEEDPKDGKIKFDGNTRKVKKDVSFVEANASFFAVQRVVELECETGKAVELLLPADAARAQGSIEDKIQSKLAALDSENFVHSLKEVHGDGTFTYFKRPKQGGRGELYKRSYEKLADGSVSLGGESEKVGIEADVSLRALQAEADKQDVLLPAFFES